MVPDIFPPMLGLRQRFPPTLPVDVRAVLKKEFVKVRARLTPGQRIAVAVGSRGITNLLPMVKTVLDLLRAAGAKPFVVPAMGSHGGATPEGQKEILAEYGITEERLQVQIEASMETARLGATDDGVDVFFSATACGADGVVVVNRIKPHTDFSSDSLGSGVLKMVVVGLGKRAGAAHYHAASARFGYEHVLRSFAKVILRTAPILFGVAIVENYRHETARLAILPREEMERGEAELFVEAKRLMPKLPFDDIDLLIVDRLGKNISGAGMDPNIIGRGVHGYLSTLGQSGAGKPIIRRLFVRDLTAESHGNAIGIGFADFTTTRLVRAMDPHKTYINALTSLTPNGAKIPIHFGTDREAIGHALNTLALSDTTQAKVIRIADTLSLERVEVSGAYADALKQRSDLEACSAPRKMKFDRSGNLAS